MTEDYGKTAAKMIRENSYMSLATTDGNRAWASPVFYAFDVDLNFYWLSLRETQHSKNILNNPKIAAVIYNSSVPLSEVDGVYLEGTVSVLDTSAALEIAEKYYFAKALKYSPDIGMNKLRKDYFDTVFQSPPEVFLQDNPRRFYKLTPQHIYKLHPTEDERVSVPLEALKSALK